MDTVEIQSQDEDVIAALERHHQMGTWECVRPERRKIDEHRRWRRVSGRGLLSVPVQHWNVDGHILRTSWWRDLEKCGARISWTGSKFSDVFEMKDWLDRIFGSAAPKVWSSPLRRLDLCLDLCVPHSVLWRAMHAPKVKRTMLLLQPFHALYLGAKPKQIYAYKKRLQGSQMWDWPENAARISTGTRIEVRLFAEALPIASLDDFANLQTFSPFQRLRFFEMSREPVVDLPEGLEVKALGLKTALNIYGYQIVHDTLNRNGNFNRDWGRLITSYELPDLDELFRIRLERFFRGNQKTSGPIEAGSAELTP